MTFTHVSVLGTGVLGAQIAFHTAYSGFQVTAYDIDDIAIERAKRSFLGLASRYLKEVPEASTFKVEAALSRLQYTTELSVAAENADLIIEAIPEKLDLKREIYSALANVAPAHTIFASNSSTLLPSAMADASGRPDRFIALHFANMIWKNNLTEIMGHAGTAPFVYEKMVAFSRQIGMVPIEIRKEQPGYVLNSLLVPFLNAAGNLLVNGIATPEAIDSAWRIGTGAPYGPFQIFDAVGLNTAYNISSSGGPKQKAFAQYLKENYIDHGKLGYTTGEGFYRYK